MEKEFDELRKYFKVYINMDSFKLKVKLIVWSCFRINFGKFNV